MPKKLNANPSVVCIAVAYKLKTLEFLKIRKHNVSETGSVSVLRQWEEDPYFVGSLRTS
jgi:hypothetical protein